MLIDAVTENDAPPEPAATPADGDNSLESTRDQIRAKLEGKAPENKDAPKTDAPKAETKPAEPVKDQDEELAALIKEDRRVKEAAKKLAAERAAHESTLKDLEPKIKRVSEAESKLKGGDFVGALKELFPETDLSQEFFWALAKSVGDKPEGDEKQDVAKLVQDALAAKEKAARDAVEAKERETKDAISKRVAAVDERVGDGFGRAVAKLFPKDAPADALADVTEAYMEVVESTVKAFDPAKYPAIGTLGATSIRILNAADALRRKNNGATPASADILKAIEDEYVEAIKGTPYATQVAAAEPPKPSPTVTASWRTDPGRPAPASDREETLSQIRDKRRAALAGSSPS